MVECGTQSYYLGSEHFSVSTNAIEPGYRQSNLKWNGELSCSEVLTAFPQGSAETVDTITELCVSLGERAALVVRAGPAPAEEVTS